MGPRNAYKDMLNNVVSPIVGGFGIKPFVRQIARSFQLVNLNSKGSTAKPREPSSPFSFLRTYLLTSTLRHQQSNQIGPAIQSVRVSVRSLGFFRDETPGEIGFRPGGFIVPNI
jgi:hypothetical protein